MNRRRPAGRASFSSASLSVRPTTGMTPGSMVSSSGARPKRRHPVLHRRVGGLRFLDVLGHGEDDVGGARGERLAGRRAAGLQHDRPSLRCAADIERAFHLEMRAGMVDRAELRRIEVDARWRGRRPGRRPSQPSHSPITTSMNSPARRIAVRVVGCVRAEIRCRPAGLAVVTAFQAARPLLIWSSEAKARAVRPGIAVGGGDGGAEADMACRWSQSPPSWSAAPAEACRRDARPDRHRGCRP